MLVVKIELWPMGDAKAARPLGTATIANVGGTQDVGKYRYELGKAGGGRGVWKRGHVAGFPRRRLLAWDLLFRCLADAVEDRNGADQRELFASRDSGEWKERALAAEERLDELRRALVLSCRDGDSTSLVASLRRLASKNDASHLEYARKKLDERGEPEPTACHEPGCYLAVDPKTGECERHGVPR